MSDLKNAEKKYGKWDIPQEDVQIESELEADREPLLSWAPKDKKTHPMNYFVPNFGVDHQIVHSQNNEKNAEVALKHDWVLKKDDDDKWILPAKSIEFKLLQTQNEEQVDREPLLGWAPKAAKTHPMNYFVPNFGLDKEILSTQASAASTERVMDQVWTPVLKKDVPKGHPMNYPVANFGMDHTIKASLKNLKNAEAKNGKWDLPKEDWF